MTSNKILPQNPSDQQTETQPISHDGQAKIDVRPFDEGNQRSYGWLIFWSDNAFHEPIRVINYRRSFRSAWRERIDIEGDPTLDASHATAFLLAMKIALTLLQSLTETNAALVASTNNVGGA